MFLQEYFYWSGAVTNGLIIFWLIVGVYFMVRECWSERKFQKKYARKTVEEKCHKNANL